MQQLIHAFKLAEGKSVHECQEAAASAFWKTTKSENKENTAGGKDLTKGYGTRNQSMQKERKYIESFWCNISTKKPDNYKITPIMHQSRVHKLK